MNPCVYCILATFSAAIALPPEVQGNVVGLYDCSARALEQFTDHYRAADPVNLIDPTGMDVVYDTDGNYLGTTKEGFTGNIYIYYGVEHIDFSNYSISEITSNGNGFKYDLTLLKNTTLDGTSKERILNHFLSHFEEQQFYGHTFSLSLLENNGIKYDSDSKYIDDAQFVTRFSTLDSFKPRISFRDFQTFPYEITVENLACSIIIHEWLSHGVFHFCDKDSNHRLSYLLVIFHDLFLQTTTSYKKMYFDSYSYYYKKECK